MKCSECKKEFKENQAIVECFNCYTNGLAREGFINQKEIEDIIHTWHLELLEKYKKPTGGEVVPNFKIANNSEVADLVCEIVELTERKTK